MTTFGGGPGQIAAWLNMRLDVITRMFTASTIMQDKAVKGQGPTEEDKAIIKLLEHKIEQSERQASGGNITGSC